MTQGFDNDKYIAQQSAHIAERVARFSGKLYLELGGKLFDDHHAARVLPGFLPDSKLRMLSRLAQSIEIVTVVSALDIEKNKVRGDLGITYGDDLLRLRSEFRRRGFLVGGAVITQWTGQGAAAAYRRRLEEAGVRVYCHRPIEGYPHNAALIASDQGFGLNDFVETERPLVVVTAPGPGSGKMAVCLSQLYQEHRRGRRAGYAKFETFPVWNLPLGHPVNIAYEAATADLGDVNMIDPFHLEAYGRTAVNYNRDIEIFPVLARLFGSIYGECPYKSPTDMGVNMAGFCISDDQACRRASLDEIVRRHYDARCRLARGEDAAAEAGRIALLMERAGVSPDDRPAAIAARARAKSGGMPSSAVILPDGEAVDAGSSPLLGPAASLLLNATKRLAGIDHELKLIPQDFIEPIQHTKLHCLGARNPRLHTDEVLVALSVLSRSDANCRRALDQLPRLRGCQAHATVMLGEVDRRIFRKLGVDITCDPVWKTAAAARAE